MNLPLKTALLLVSAASAAVAQARPLSDSVMALNRAGRWEQAGQLAVASMRTASDVEERCALLVGGLYASSRMFQFTNGPRQLKTFDDMCGKTTTATRLAHEIEGLRRDLQLPPMPPTGVDWSAIDQFWMAVDTLSRGIEPSFAQWRALMITPGYRIAAISYPTIARAIDIALRPSRRAERDSVLRRSSLDSAVVAHVLVAAASREELVRFRTALEPAVRDTIAYAVKNTSRFLPPNSVDHAPPLVTFAIFASDGFSQEPGIVLDLYHARENGFADFLSHEFHHSFASKLDRTTAGPGAADGRLFHAIRQLKNEGIPDMLDKAAHPLVTSPGMRWYADSYNAAYDKTPATLKVLDSLLVAGSDSAKMVDAGNRAQGLLVYGSHPNGAYMAHTILDAFGRDSLIATIPSVFAFIRMYESAEAKRGNPSPFSAAGHAALSAMESRHMKP